MCTVNIEANCKVDLQVFGLEDELLAAATAAKLPVSDCDNCGEFSRADILLGVLLTNTGLLLSVDDVTLLQLEFSMELLLLLFIVVLVARTAVGLTG